MNRRKFIKGGSLAGLAIATLSFESCQSPAARHPEENPTAAPADDFQLNEMTVDELQQKMSSGEWTSQSITEQYLKRIDSIDRNGPQLHAIIELNPDAVEIAKVLDKERKDGKVRGPLHGIPILIKDNIDTADKMMTTAGSLALEGNIATQDAWIVKQLRAAGAVIIGKTNLSEFANFRSTRSTSGWSSRGGQTRNPYILDRNPCGSSSGTGSAVSANLCTIGIGTETNGSVACPSSVNGIVGIKPTVGLWSRSGIIPISATQDTAGPMTRTVRDAAILLSALCETDPSDSASVESQGKGKKDYTQFLDAQGLKGKRIGIEKSLLKGHEAVDALLQKAIEQMKNQGATFVEVELVDKLKDVEDDELTVLKYEFKDGLNRYLASAHAKVKSLQAIIDFNKQNEAKAMPYFKQELLESSQQLGDLNSKEYKEALHKLRTVTRDAIDQLLKKHSLDAICAPSDGPPWCTDPVNGDAFTGYGFYSPAAVAGYPSITVPMGMVYELPVGLCFIGPAFGEPGLLSIAYAYEQSSKNRKAPRFLPTMA